MSMIIKYWLAKIVIRNFLFLILMDSNALQTEWSPNHLFFKTEKLYKPNAKVNACKWSYIFWYLFEFFFICTVEFSNNRATWCWKVICLQLNEGFILFKFQNRIGFTISSKRGSWSFIQNPVERDSFETSIVTYHWRSIFWL